MDIRSLCRGLLLLAFVCTSLAFHRVIPWVKKASFIKWEQKSGIHVKLYAATPRTTPTSEAGSPGAAEEGAYAGTEDIFVSDAHIGDIFDLIRLANGQFSHTCKTVNDLVKLNLEIIKLFFPKLVFTSYMSHSVIGVRSSIDNRLVGFVDLSLQPSSGTMDALIPLPFENRKLLYGNSLEPYLCNLLVEPKFRKRGLGRKLVSACEDRALSWGCRAINLHVERESLPAFTLYVSSGFAPIQTKGNVVFMKKILNPVPLRE
jgi:GNAT superfamily N-acetyltransferase